MSRFTKESLDRLRERVDLVDVLSRHVQFKRAGASFKALCPFHDEKTASFVINKGDTHYHCFGCGAHGDAISFLMQQQKMTFTSAVQTLADRYQVTLETVAGSFEEKRTNRTRLKQAVDSAGRFYQWALLHTKEGHTALEYLYKRGISRDFIEAFRVGYAPKRSQLFQKWQSLAGFSDEELMETGLITEQKRDFFQERITLAILDASGHPVGFSARKFREATFGGKYINTKETPLFKKSRMLFGLAQSRKRIIAEKQAIIVEGGLDALRMIYHGFDTTVAALGTAFGQEHVQELIQLGVGRVFLLFDGDEAGKKAAIKVGNLFQAASCEVLVADLGSGQDPDSILAAHGPVAINRALVGAKEYLEFVHGDMVGRHSSTSPAEKHAMLQEIVAMIRTWQSPVMVHESLKRLCSLAQIPEDLLGIGTIVSPSIYAKKAQAIGDRASVDPDRVLEADLLRWLILYGHVEKTVVELCSKNIGIEDLVHPVAKKLYDRVLQMLQESGRVDMTALVNECNDEAVEQLIQEILEKKVNRDKVELHLIETLKRIKERNWMRERDRVAAKLQDKSLSEEEQMRYLAEFSALKKAAPCIHK